MKKSFLFITLVYLAMNLTAESAFTKIGTYNTSSNAYALSNDGKYAAFIQSGKVAIIDLEKNSFVKNITAKANMAMCFSGDGKYIYFTGDEIINRINIDKEKVEVLEDAFSDRYYGPLILRSGNCNRHIVAGFHGNFDGTAIFDVKKGSWSKYKSERFMWPVSYAFSGDERFVVGVGTNNTLTKMWETESGTEMWGVKNHSFPCDAVFSKDGKIVYICGWPDTLALDVKSGKILETIRTGLPSVGGWCHGSAVPEQNVVYYALANPGGLKETCSLYAVELSSGKIMEELNFENPFGSDVIGLKVSGDGTKLAVKRQMSITFYKVERNNLKAIEVPVKEKNPLHDELIGTILFDKEYNESLMLNEDNIYCIRNRYLGNVIGRYEFKGNKIIFYPPTTNEHDYVFKSVEGTTFSFDAEYTIDTSYETFKYKYQLVSKDGKHFPVTVWSDVGKVYDYEGIKVKKLSDSYIVLDSNMKMRSKPSLSAKTVSMDMTYYKEGWIWSIPSRQVVFKNSVLDILGETVQKDTIDGITAPWLLVYERGQFVWIFGGYGLRITGADLEKYRKIEEDTRFDILLQNGLRKAYRDGEE